MFQGFESFLRTEIGFVEDDIEMAPDEYNSKFITNELQAGIYTLKDISEALLKILQPVYELDKNSFKVEFVDITMKTNLVVRPGFIAIRFDEKSFFSTILGLLQDGIINARINTLVRNF